MLHWGTASIGSCAWVLTVFSFFTWATLVASSLVWASTWACIHVTPPQHSQQATQAGHTKGVTHCSQNCICAAKKRLPKSIQVILQAQETNHPCAGVMVGAVQGHLDAVLDAAALSLKLAQDGCLGSLCSQQVVLHLFMLNLQHLLTTHSLLVVRVRMHTV